jgi:hypothetical protein
MPGQFGGFFGFPSESLRVLDFMAYGSLLFTFSFLLFALFL